MRHVHANSITVCIAARYGNETLLNNIVLNGGQLFVFYSKSKTECFKVTFKTQQQCININIWLWRHVSVLLDHLQANINRYEVQSVAYHVLWGPYKV
jgi:hypothetical protein